MITPLILGKGRAGLAVARALESLALQEPELGLQRPEWLERGTTLSDARAKYDRPLLVVTNPHGLHAETLLEADAASFPAALCEKPVCVSPEQAKSISGLKLKTGVFHGYRMMWGPQRLRTLVTEGKLGELFAIEGKYWQASAAERGLKATTAASGSWKNDPRLAGTYDVFLDLGTHWADLMAFFYGSAPIAATGFRSFALAEAAHRETHVNLTLNFKDGGRAVGSISKAIHGATNELEVHLLGTKGSAAWSFLSPDEVRIGEGRHAHVLRRESDQLGSGQPAHHGMGWLEGYLEISRRLIHDAFFGRDAGGYPTVESSLAMMKPLFAIEWE